MFGIKNKSKSPKDKVKKTIDMSEEAKRRQQAAITSYYIKKRKDEDKRGK